MKEAEEFIKSDSKNKEAALRCARICLLLYKKGRPFTDYPDLVAISIQGGTFMGNINHSKAFATSFLSFVAFVVPLFLAFNLIFLNLIFTWLQDKAAEIVHNSYP